MSKFDAAILILTEYFEFDKGPRNSKPEVDAAIRVLEAAGKVDKEASGIALTWIPLDRLPIGLSALISALPGKD